MRRMICPEAAKAARELVKMIAPVLLPAEQKLYFRKAYELCCGLVRGREVDVLRLLAPGKN